MARVSSIGADGDVVVCDVVEFEKNLLWKNLLGPIPTRAQEVEGEEQGPPESEYILQRLIELYPGILPWHEFHDSPSAEEVQVCVVCKEVKSAATDILLIERTPGGKGRFVIVETKLVKNAEIYRAVLGQVLEYAAEISSGETLKSLEQKANEYWKDRRGKVAVKFQHKMRQVFKRNDWREVIWESALEGARRRDIRLLIVSDSLPEELRLAVIYLPAGVLLTAVELQAHQVASKHQSVVLTGLAAANGTAPSVIDCAVREYFSRVQLSHAVVQSVKAGTVVAQALDRGKATAAKPSRPYSDHLEKLGSTDDIPRQTLEMLKNRTEKTQKGRVDEGQECVTLRFWGMPGLLARESEEKLLMSFTSETPVGYSKMEEARGVLEKHLRNFPLKGGRKAKYTFYFPPISRNTPLQDAQRVIEWIEGLYRELRKLKE